MLVALRPHLHAAVGIGQRDGESCVFAFGANAALQQEAHPQFVGGGPRIVGSRFEARGGDARSDANGLEAHQADDEFLDQAFGEADRTRITRQIGEGHHGDRGIDRRRCGPRHRRPRLRFGHGTRRGAACGPREYRRVPALGHVDDHRVVGSARQIVVFQGAAHLARFDADDRVHQRIETRVAPEQFHRDVIPFEPIAAPLQGLDHEKAQQLPDALRSDEVGTCEDAFQLFPDRVRIGHAADRRRCARTAVAIVGGHGGILTPSSKEQT